MATNSTTYYNLPVFAASDKPKWLIDWNTTMNLIDSAIAAAKAAGDNAQITANANAIAITGLNESVSTMSTALDTLTTNVTTLTGNVQRINELIGNGTPTTQDKTIIGAINELKAAIDALAPSGAVQADEVEYDNTSSGLTATNVQDAIDELAQGGGAGYDFNLSSHVTATVTANTGVTLLASTSVNVLTNANKSIGKVYGAIAWENSSITGAYPDWVTIATISASNLPTIAEAYDILIGAAMMQNSAQSHDAFFGTAKLHFNTNGTIDVMVQAGNLALWSGVISLPPCIYFLKDLGD